MTTNASSMGKLMMKSDPDIEETTIIDKDENKGSPGFVQQEIKMTSWLTMCTKHSFSKS